MQLLYLAEIFVIFLLVILSAGSFYWLSFLSFIKTVTRSSACYHSAPPGFVNPTVSSVVQLGIGYQSQQYVYLCIYLCMHACVYVFIDMCLLSVYGTVEINFWFTSFTVHKTQEVEFMGYKLFLKGT